VLVYRARLGGTRTAKGSRTLGEPTPRAAATRASTRTGKVEAGDRVWRSKVPTHRRSREAASGRPPGPRHRHPGGHAFGVPSRGPAPCLPPPTRAHGSCASGSKAGKDRSPPTSNGRGSPSRSQQVLERKTQHPARRLIHPSAWRDCMKSGPLVVIHYSSTHEKTISNRSFRCRMELYRASHART
jgi:hypothetical protein